MLKEYWDELTTMLLRPILFFSKMPRSEWTGKPLTFLAVTSGILSIFLTLIVFITTYIPIGSTLLEKVSGWKTVITVPVMTVLALMFFVITWAMVFAALLAALAVLFGLLGALIYAGAVTLGGKGSIKKDIAASFYSSGAFIVFSLMIFPVILTRWKLMDFTNFSVGYNMLYSFSVLYLYGIQAIIARKEHDLPKWKAFACALIPALFLTALGFAVNRIILPRTGPFIG